MKEIIDNLVVKLLLPNFPIKNYEIILNNPDDPSPLKSYDIYLTLPYMTKNSIAEELVDETKMLLKLLGMSHLDSVASYRNGEIVVLVRGNQ